jgi:hypothetical protein
VRELAASVGQVLSRVIGSPHPVDLAATMLEVIGLCEAAVPHPDWAMLREVDFAADVPVLRAWLDGLLRDDPPDAPLRGLYFALCHPMPDAETVTADLEVVGTSKYDRSDPGMRWLFSRRYFPEQYAASPAMGRLYHIAYGTHEFGAQVPGSLGNDAEWPIGLAFAVLASRAILEGRTADDFAADQPRVGVAAGWIDGDLLLIGEVAAGGFEPLSS